MAHTHTFHVEHMKSWQIAEGPSKVAEGGRSQAGRNQPQKSQHMLEITRQRLRGFMVGNGTETNLLTYITAEQSGGTNQLLLTALPVCGCVCICVFVCVCACVRGLATPVSPTDRSPSLSFPISDKSPRSTRLEQINYSQRFADSDRMFSDQWERTQVQRRPVIFSGSCPPHGSHQIRQCRLSFCDRMNSLTLPAGFAEFW